MALLRRPKLRVICHARNAQLHLLLSGSGRCDALQVGLDEGAACFSAPQHVEWESLGVVLGLLSDFSSLLDCRNTPFSFFCFEFVSCVA